MSLSTNIVLTGSATGRNGTGAITLTGARVGDVVYCTPNTTDSFTNGNDQLETSISVDDEVQQVSSNNLTSVTWTIFLFRPIATGC